MSSPTRFQVDPDVRRAETLDKAFYLDDTAWSLARERVFARSWQWIGDLHDVDVLTGLLANDDRTLTGLRDAVERRRTTLLAGIGPPLALLAVDLGER